jgi:hypothetical protein
MPYRQHLDATYELVDELLGANKRPKPKRSAITFREIAKMTGVSEATVGVRAAIANIKKPSMRGKGIVGRPEGCGKKFSPNRAVILRLWKGGAGMPPVEIAAAIGMTPSGVRRIINQQKATEAKVLALSLEGVAPAEIAHQLGLSESDVSAILSVDQK